MGQYVPPTALRPPRNIRSRQEGPIIPRWTMAVPILVFLLTGVRVFTDDDTPASFARILGTPPLGLPWWAIPLSLFLVLAVPAGIAMWAWIAVSVYGIRHGHIPWRGRLGTAAAVIRYVGSPEFDHPNAPRYRVMVLGGTLFFLALIGACVAVTPGHGQ